MLTRSRAGFTLIELLISVAAMGIVIFYTLRTFTIQHQTYVVVDQVSEVQNNSRAIAALIERDIRNSGYMVPAAAAVCGRDRTTGPDTLVASDTDAMLPVHQLPVSLQDDELGVDTTTTPASGTTVLSVSGIVIDGTPSYKKDSGSAGLDSDFRVNGGAIVVDLANPQRGVACGQITAVSGNSISVNFETVLNAGNGTSTPDLYVVPGHYYAVNTGTIPRQLERDGIALAKDVEDLQVAYFYDSDQDNQVTGNEYRGDSGSNPYDTTLIDGNDLREIRFHVVVATRSDDPRNPNASGTGQARENRTPASTPGDDGKRRRVYTSTVRVRNNML
ncbi:MAG: PilW family protein [Myxococcota bacterium]